MNDLWFTHVDSPLGPLLLAAGEDGLERISFPSGSKTRGPEPGWRRDPDRFVEVARQLTEYFAGERRSFDVPLVPRGTSFQLAVWRALCDIPYGETTSYGALARRLGRPSASRAVGAANGQNPLPIIVPCHRVIGANGSLTGFGGGLPAKTLLLELERGQRTFRTLAGAAHG
jgi:methylated-DNA-[protein]-cysteine S-methyltransferase